MKELFRSIYNKYWGELFFFIYFLLAWHFFLERTLFLDNAFQTFLMLQDNGIEVNADRWPAIIYRIIPFALSKFNVGLLHILLSFSLSYVIVQYLFFAVIQHVLDDKRNALVYIIILSLPVVNGFFWCNSELVLALCLTIFWISLLRAEYYLVSMSIAICLAWVHPLVIFPFSFAIIYLYLEGMKVNIKLCSSIAIFYICYLVKSIFFPNWYDNAKSQSFHIHLKEYVWQDMFGGLGLLQHLDYLFLLIIVFALALLLYKSKFLLSVMLFTFVLFYLLVVDIARGTGPVKLEFYEEINLYVICFFAVLSISHFWQNLSAKYYWAIVGVVTLFCTYRWNITSAFYTQRIEWYNELLTKNDRVILNASQFEQSPLVMEWASAFESLIISSLHGESKSIVITKDMTKFKEALNSGKMLTEFREYPYELLDQRYFKLKAKAYYINDLD